MNKKISLILYYAGLILGTMTVNYILMYHGEYADTIVYNFEKLNRLEQMNRQALFLYLFLKRLKQILLLCFLYLQVSKLAVLILMDIYFSFLLSVIVSLCFYYYGAVHMFWVAGALLPQCIYYVLLKNVGLKLYDVRITGEGIKTTKVITAVVIVTIIMTIAEMSVNLKIGS